MTAQSIQTTSARRFVISEPLKAAWEHGNQFFVTSAAAFMSAMFSMQHGVLPWWVAVPLAIGFEWTYLRGLANADKTGKTLWAPALNWAAMITSVVYGVLYVLGHYGVIAATPDAMTALLLAVAHVLPMAVLSFCGANLRRVHRREERERERLLLDEAHEQERQEVERQRELQRKRDEIQIERERKQADLELAWKQEQLKIQAKAQAKALRSSVTDTVTASVTDTVTASVTAGVMTVPHRVTTLSRDDQRAAIVTAYKTLGDSLNVSNESEKLGISRGMWYKLREEAKAKGEL